MSTLVKVIIVVIEFLVLFAYEFFHIREEIKNHNDKKNSYKYSYSLTAKEYKKFAAISYSILNLGSILAFIFMFPNHIFLCYNKLVFVGCLVFFIISISLLYTHFINRIDNDAPNSALIAIISIFSIFVVILINFMCLNYAFDFIKVLNTEKHSQTISNVDNVTKLNDKSGNIIYMINFKDTKKSEVIYEKDVKSFEISDTTFISKVTTMTTKISSELKNAKEYTENKNSYSIFVTEDMLIDLTTEE